MTALLRERRILERMRQAVEAGSHTPSPELYALAEDVAQLGQQTSHRLEECAALLGRGLRSEAQHLARQDPNLFELLALSEHSVALAWRELCQRLELPPPPSPASELSDMVRSSLEATGKGIDELEALFRLHRRVSLTGGTRERLFVLRRIAALEPEKEIWKEDVAALEVQRLKEMDAEFSQAVEKSQSDLVRKLHREIAADHWLHKPPIRMRQRFRDAQAQLDRAALEGKVSETARALSEAYCALDFHGVDASLSAWDGLTRDNGFESDAATMQQVAEAREWYERTLAGQREDEAHRTALDGMRKGVADVGLPGGRMRTQDLEALFRAVSAFGRPTDEALLAAYRAGFARLRRLETRRSRLLGLLFGAGLVIVVLAVFFGARLLLRRATVRDWALRIDRALVAEEHTEAAWLLAELDSLVPKADDPGVAVLRLRVAELKERVETRARQRNEILRALEAVAPSYQPLDESWRLIERLRPLSSKPDELLELAELESGVRSAESDLRLALEEVDRSEIEACRSALAALAEADIESDPLAFDDQLHSLEQRLAAVSPALSELASRKDDLERSCRRERQRLASARVAIVERRAQIAAVYGTLPDVGSFATAVAAAKQRLDLDKDVRSLVLTLDRNVELYKAAVRGEWTLGELAMPDGVTTALRRLPPGPNPWRRALEVVAADLTWESEVARAREELLALSEVDLYYNLRLFVPEDPRNPERRRAYYFLEDPKLSISSDGVGTFLGKMYTEGFNLEIGSFQHNGLRIETRLAPHAELLRELLQRLRKADVASFARALWRELGGLAGDPSLNPVVAMIFARRLLAPLSRVQDPLLSAVDELDRLWRDHAAPVAWLAEGIDVLPEARARRADLDALPDLGPAIALWELRRELYLASLLRRVRCVGQVQARPDGGRFNVTEEPVVELWVVRQEQGNACFRVVARSEDGNFRALPTTSLIEGEPVFAPRDGLDTRVLLLGLLDRNEVTGDPPGFPWPDSWPCDVRP